MIIELVHPQTQARAFARAASVQRAQAVIYAVAQDPAWFTAQGIAHREDGAELALFVQIKEIEKPKRKKKEDVDPDVNEPGE